MKKIIAGNWKLNGSLDFIKEYFTKFKYTGEKAEIIFCPPNVYLTELAKHKNNAGFKLGAQNAAEHENGAHTGDTAAAMLKDVGCDYVILGHSERRLQYMESSQMIARKAEKAVNAELTPIICIGEDINAKQLGYTQKFLEEQVKYSIPESIKDKDLIIAYEPIWAIGTGQSATVADIEENLTYIKVLAENLGIKNAKLLYGGSVKPENAKDILSVKNVDGVLVGGASLKPDQFKSIAESC